MQGTVSSFLICSRYGKNSWLQWNVLVSDWLIHNSLRNYTQVMTFLTYPPIHSLNGYGVGKTLYRTLWTPLDIDINFLLISWKSWICNALRILVLLLYSTFKNNLRFDLSGQEWNAQSGQVELVKNVMRRHVHVQIGQELTGKLCGPL